MESLAALSIAAAVGQFLDLASKLFKASRDIAQCGAAVHVAQLDQVAKELGEKAANIINSLKPIDASTLSIEEQRLCALASECGNISGEIESALLYLRTNSSTKRWDTYRIALSSVWDRKRIDEEAKRVVDCRSRLTLDLLAVVNSQLRQQGHSMGRLEDGNKEIIDLLTTVIAKLDRREAEVVSAILAADSTTHDSARASKMADTAPEVSNQHFRMICGGLLFRGMSARKETITESHDRTLDWVWEREDPGNKLPWDDLAEWLRHGTGCYWLFGKPGSGKSTLMKHLEQDIRTANCLRD